VSFKNQNRSSSHCNLEYPVKAFSHDKKKNGILSGSEEEC
jgi:hypothetical protein